MCFLHTLLLFLFPSFDHDAFMHHTMHVLDAPDVDEARFSKLEHHCLLMNFVYW